MSVRDGPRPGRPRRAARGIVATFAAFATLAVLAALGAVASPPASAGPVPARGGAPTAAAANDDAHWATQYLLHCSGCHGTGGAGVGSVPDLRGNLGHFLATPEGRRFVLQVPGVANARLSDADLAQLTNWMVRRFAPDTMPKDFRPYDAGEVRAARSAVPADVTGERRRVVAALRERGLDAR